MLTAAHRSNQHQVSGARWVLIALALGTAYFLAGRIALEFATLQASVSPVWPPTGIAIAGLLLWGLRLWPVIFVGAFLFNHLNAGTVWTSLAIAGGNTAEAVVAALLVQRYAGGRSTFASPHGILRFTLLAGLGATAISATVGVASLHMAGFIPLASVGPAWTTWWLADATGAITLTPLILVWAERGRNSLPLQRAPEAALLAAATLGLGVLMLQAPLVRAYTTLPLVLWAALRFTPREAVTVAVSISAFAVASTLQGGGPFALEDPNTGLLVLQGFIAVANLTGLVLGTTVHERRLAEANVRRTRDELEINVQERTQSLTESEARFSGFLMNLPGLAWIKDWKGRYVLANPAFAQSIQRPADQIIGRTDFELFPAEIAKEYRANDDQARETRQPVRTTERQLVDGQTRYSLVHKFPIPHPDGRASVGGVAIDVTERTRAEQAAIESRQRMEEAQRLSHVGSWDWDVAANALTWSDELCRIYGLDPAHHTPSYDDFMARLHPEDRTRVQGLIEGAYQTGSFPDFDHRIVRPDGSVRWLHAQGRIVRDAAGRVVRMAGTGQDVTERQEGEERFRVLLESTPDALVVVAPDGRIQQVNQATERLFGYARGELLGRVVEDLVPEASRGNHARHRADYLRQPASRPMGVGRKLKGRRKDGSEVPVEISLSPVQTPSGPLVISAIRDVSERLRAEEAVRESERRFADVFAASPIGISVSRLRDGTILDVNEAFARMCGVGRDEMVGRSPAEFNPPLALNLGRPLPEAAPVAGPPVEYEADLLRPDGSTRRVAGSSLVLPFGGEPCLVTMARDITDARQAEQLRAQAQEQAKTLDALRRADEFKARFINVAAHELNTPLTPIKLQLHLLRTLPPSHLEKGLAVLERNFDRMAILIQNMLDVGKIESGKVHLRKVTMDVGASLEHTLASFQELARQGGVRLVSAHNGDLWVDADPQRVEQVLFNLLSNALKFTPPGGAVRLQATEREHDVLVCVRDTGRGLLPDQMMRLFQPFSQVHEGAQTSGTPGTGLGLYISRQLVELHGGRLWVESEGPEKGALFCFTLPRGPAGATSAPTEGDRETPSSKVMHAAAAPMRVVGRPASQRHESPPTAPRPVS